MKEESVQLFYQEGSSDKVYHASLEKHGGAWVVNFAYGRRGNTLTTGTKTKAPVDFEVAKKAYDKLIQSKVGKGYKVDGAQSDPITVTTPEDTDIRPQLLNEIEEEDVARYIDDPDYCAQEKNDGRRRIIMKEGNSVIGANKKGFAVALTKEIEEACLAIPGDWIFDGEDMGTHIVLFDKLTEPELTYRERYTQLKALLMDLWTTNPSYMHVLKIAETGWSTGVKQAMLAQLKRDNAEGIVFKNSDASYTAGRPASGGNQFKFKFYATASCIVASIHSTKSSIGLEVYESPGRLISVGNVTVYPRQNMPKEGDIVEVKYLYYFPGGSLYQPVLLDDGNGNPVRDDVDTDECKTDQLKLKKEIE